MGWTAAIGPALGIARTLGGGLARNTGSGMTGMNSPFDVVFNPDIQPMDFEMPERNPRFKEQAKLQSVFDETPGLMASALLGGDTEGALLDAGPGREVLPVDSGPPPQRIDLAELAKRQNQPVRIDLSKIPRERTPNELAADQGYTVTSVMGEEVPPGSPVSAFSVGPERLPQENVTEIARRPVAGGVTDLPKSVFDEEVPAPATSARVAPSAFEPQFDTGTQGEDSVFGDIGDGIGYVQDWLGGSAENPLFQTGMALLASGYDGSNPFTGIQSGLNAIPQLSLQQQKSDLERRKGEADIADAQQQKQLQEALAMIAEMYGGDQGGEGPSSQRSKGQAYVVR